MTGSRDSIVQAAQDLLDNAAANDAFDALTQRYTEIWSKSGPQHYDVRDDAYRMVRAIDELKLAIKSIAAENRVANFQKRLRSSST